MPSVRFAGLFSCAWLLLGVGVTKAGAQSLTTASKGAEISAFGGYVASTPDYGPFIKTGIGAGVDFTIFPRFPVAPSFEVRAHESVGTNITEKSVLFGIRIQRDIHERFHPYGDFLIGGGEIVYKIPPTPDYTSDKSKAFSYGGGINIDVAHHLAVKFDFQQQAWNLGLNGVTKPQGGDYTLAPTTMMVGVTYTVPFRKLNRHGDFR